MKLSKIDVPWDIFSQTLCQITSSWTHFSHRGTRVQQRISSARTPGPNSPWMHMYHVMDELSIRARDDPWLQVVI